MANLIRGHTNARSFSGTIFKIPRQSLRHGTLRIILSVHHPQLLLNQSLSFQSRQLSSDNQDKSDAPKKSDHVSVRRQLQSPPNIITLTRIACTPVLVYWITSEQYAFAAGGCVLAGLSDGLDGYLAKTYNWGTTVGSYLDPVADKIMVNSLAISLWYTSILPTPLIVVWAIKDIGLLSGTAWMLYQNYNSVNFFTTSLRHQPLEVKPTQVAKLNTALQFATLGAGIISPISTLSPIVLDTLCWTTAATTVGSVLSYAGHSAINRRSKGDD